MKGGFWSELTSECGRWNPRDWTYGNFYRYINDKRATSKRTRPYKTRKIAKLLVRYSRDWEPMPISKIHERASASGRYSGMSRGFTAKQRYGEIARFVERGGSWDAAGRAFGVSRRTVARAVAFLSQLKGGATNSIIPTRTIVPVVVERDTKREDRMRYGRLLRAQTDYYREQLARHRAKMKVGPVESEQVKGCGHAGIAICWQCYKAKQS